MLAFSYISMDLQANLYINSQNLYKHRPPFLYIFIQKYIKIRVRNENITDEGLMHLKNIKSLDLCWNNIITDAGLAHLSSAYILDFGHNTHITDAGLKHLANVEFLDLYLNENITDARLKHFVSMQSLDLTCNENITDIGLQCIAGCYLFCDNLAYCNDQIPKNANPS